MYEVKRKFNENKKFGEFILRTRLRYHDENIIKDELNDIYKIPKNSKLVIDIGANIGVTSLMCAKQGAFVYAFEPEILNFDVLKYNVKINNFYNKIICINKGVGKSNKLTELFIHPSNSGATSSYLEQKGLNKENYQIVEFISINTVFDFYDINYCDLLKMDCEGSEKDIINDLYEELINKIGQISVEFHDKKIMNDLIKKLSKWYNPIHLKRYEWCFTKK